MASLWSAVEKQCLSNANDVSSTRLTVSAQDLVDGYFGATNGLRRPGGEPLCKRQGVAMS